MALEKFNLPPGRIVGGNPVVAQKKTNFQTKQPILDKDGKEVLQYRCDYAILKDVFMREVWPHLVREVATAYPINPQTGQPNVNRDFAWKFVDGDSPECPKNSKVPYNQREGYPGHYILKISTEAFQPKMFKRENGAFFDFSSQFKTGFYAVCNADIKVHTDNDGGLYINPNLFEFIGYGPEISGQGGANPEEVFGNQTYQLPAGASATPIGGAPAPSMPMGGMPGGAPLPQSPMPVYQNQGIPSAPVTGGMAPNMTGYAQPAVVGMQMPNAGGMPGNNQPVTPVAQPAYPALAMDFVNNAMGAPGAPLPAQPMNAAPAMPGQPPAMQSGVYGAGAANTSPSNPMGMPQFPQR